MNVALRNVDADLSTDPVTWPFEALVTVLERGLVRDWKPILKCLREHPWGEFASRVTSAAAQVDDSRLETLFALAVERARDDQEHIERDAVAQRVRAAIEATGMSQADFAREIGTSASRLSTYARGSVMPSAALLLRMESVSARQAARGTPRTRS